jgi:hypothetical protein
MVRNRARLALLGSLLVLFAGCGGGKSNQVTNPPVSGNTHTESEPNDATPQVLGTLATTDFVVGGSASSDTDVDLYRFTLTATSNIHATLAWSGGSDLGVALLDTNLALLHPVDTANNPETMTHNSWPAGSWVLRVNSHTAAATPYTLTLGKH